MIVNYAGDARGCTTEAIGFAKSGDFEKAQEMLEQARSTIALAHHKQTDLISAEANGEELPFSVLLVHGQDHLMTSMAVLDMAEQFIDLYKQLQAVKEQI